MTNDRSKRSKRSRILSPANSINSKKSERTIGNDPENGNGTVSNVSPHSDPSAQHGESLETSISVTGPQGNPLQPNQINESNQANPQGAASNIETTEPASDVEQRKFKTSQNQNRARQRRLRQAMLTHESRASQNLPNYPVYFLVKLVGTDLVKANPIAIQRSLRQEAGNFAADIKQQNRNTLLVKATSQRQASKLPEIKTIASHEVVITAHTALNQSKGTVFSETLSACKIEEIEEVLRDQGATKVERMKRRVNGVLVDTHRHIITFNKPDPPPTIRISDWHFELLDLYIPTPMQCINCQKLGHTKNHCRRGAPVCARCAQEGHQARDCQNEPKCANCDGAHRSMDKKCPHYEYKSEVLATQTRQKCTYHEAIDQVQDRFRSEGKRYNFVTRRQTQQRPPPPTPDNPGNGATATQTSSLPQTEPSQTQVAETPNEDVNALRTDQPSTSTPRESAQTLPSGGSAGSPPGGSSAEPPQKKVATDKQSDGTKPKSKEVSKKTKNRTRKPPSDSISPTDSSESSVESPLDVDEYDETGDSWSLARKNRSRKPQLPHSQSQTVHKNRYQILDSDTETDPSDTSARAKRRRSPEEEGKVKKPATEPSQSATPETLPLETQADPPTTQSETQRGTLAGAVVATPTPPLSTSTSQSEPAKTTETKPEKAPAPPQGQQQPEVPKTSNASSPEYRNIPVLNPQRAGSESRFTPRGGRGTQFRGRGGHPPRGGAPPLPDRWH